ncbi:MAG: hypothetical protein AB8B95_14910 [Pseudohongiellaceae bacterium]
MPYFWALAVDFYPCDFYPWGMIVDPEGVMYLIPDDLSDLAKKTGSFKRL